MRTSHSCGCAVSDRIQSRMEWKWMHFHPAQQKRLAPAPRPAPQGLSLVSELHYIVFVFLCMVVGVYSEPAGGELAKAFGTFSPHVPHTHLACTCICMHVRLLPLPCVFFICHPHLYIHLLTATATALRGIMRRGLSMTTTSKCWGGTECPSCRVNK